MGIKSYPTTLPLGFKQQNVLSWKHRSATGFTDGIFVQNSKRKYKHNIHFTIVKEHFLYMSNVGFSHWNGEGNGAWWAAVYGVAQSRTRLKWLSSHWIWHLHIIGCFQVTLQICSPTGDEKMENYSFNQFSITEYCIQLGQHPKHRELEGKL